MSSEQIKTKRVPDDMRDISIQWFSEILRKQIRESSYKLTPNAQAGNGFLSTMVRVEFETKEEGIENTKQNVIVKLLPAEDDKLVGETRELVLKDNYDRTEILSYKILIPDLVKEIPSLGKYFCPVLFAEIREADESAKIPYSSVLVLQDLKPAGYFMVNFAESLSPEHFSQGLDFASKLHAASLNIEKRNQKSIISHYHWFPKCYIPIQLGENRPEPTLMKSYFPAGFPALYKLLSQNPRITEETIKSLMQIEARTQNVSNAILKAGQRYPCIVHGDLWSHNLMVQKDKNIPIKAIDLQMMGYMDPTHDLAIYIMVCLPFDSITVEGVYQALEEYYKNDRKFRAELGLIARRSFEEFKLCFETYGLAYSFIWIVAGGPTFTSNAKFMPKFFKIFELLVEMKVIDFVLSLI